MNPGQILLRGMLLHDAAAVAVSPGFDVRLFGLAMAAEEGVDLGDADAHFCVFG
jgi:hypothetical protein